MEKFIMKNSSASIVRRIGMAKSRVRKFLWFLILLTLVFTCAFYVIKFMNKYFTHPVVISLKEEQMETLEFPSVTICNFNRMKKHFRDCLVYNITDKKQCEYLPERFKNTIYGNKQFAPKGPRLVVSKEKIHPNKNATEEQKFLYSYFQTPESILMRMSHQPDFIHKCYFAGHRCQMKTQTRYFFHYRYGFCMTFNIPQGNKKKVILKTNQTGFEGGLELELIFDPLNYLWNTHSVGGRVVIHPTEEMPDLEEQGFNISPGFQTSIALKQTLNKRLTHSHQDTCFNYSKEKGTAPHTQRECRKLCIQQYNFKTCRCIDPNMILLKGFSACDLWNDQQLKCLRRASERIKEWSCNCPQACNSIYYNEQISRAKFPSTDWIFRNDIYLIKEDPDFVVWEKEQYRFNGKVNVFYSTLSRKTFMQAPAFHDSEVFSNVGGALGLWLGISISFIFELLEIVTTFGKHAVLRHKSTVTIKKFAG